MTTTQTSPKRPDEAYLLCADAIRDGARDACFSDATVAVTSTGPTVPAIVTALRRLGIGEIRLIGGEHAVGELDVQRGRAYDRSQLGVPVANVLERALAAEPGDGVLRSIDFPGSVDDWGRALDGASLAIAPVDGPMLFLPWLDELNAAALATGVPWTTVAVPDAEEVYLGPTFVPGVTACHRCYEMRCKSHVLNHQAYLDFQAHVRANPDEVKDFGFLPPVADLAASLVSLEVARALSPDLEPRTVGALVTFSLSSFSFTSNPVLPLPKCDACGFARSAAKTARRV